MTEKIQTEEDKLDEILEDIFKELEIKLPWEGDFDEFMSDPNNALDFDK